MLSLDHKPLSNRNAMSQVLSIRVRGSLDCLSSGIEQYIDLDVSFSERTDIFFENHHSVDILFTTESCMYFNDKAQAWSTGSMRQYDVEWTALHSSLS
jgi:hypothetical protein